jgi:MinD superfamily P-loop ATPase
MNPIYMIGGGKGGVGKSIVSMALVDYLCEIIRDKLRSDRTCQAGLRR